MRPDNASRAKPSTRSREGVGLAFLVAAVVMAVAGYFYGRLMPDALPSRIIPSSNDVDSEELEVGEA